ncbi:thiol:disulfide interchange protein DsbA [Polaromonas sp. OV174]|uniref:thiol:disulfide interchange protein DsbA/DsbL n=1 Tax=Polaromonas sp. OV174 TaxID=1855300 RepID=UPI0008E0BE20|nr:thiol:disulfide interchange protein DsbA/DsbL [Polaromonas sp. OV174]SFC75205.1 thiol:disulfide interchange protein DsbA [Polaromonas sp. OV174]
MQRREFSLSAASVAAAATLGAAVLPTAAQAQAAAFKDGSDYLTLGKRAPVEASAGQVEVVEFFWYNCPHCNAFEPQFDAWAKKVPKDVSIRRAPVAFRPDFEPQQRLYFVLEGMGKVEELHKKVFYAIHVEKQSLNTAEQVAAWAEKQGIAKAKFVAMYNSFSVSTKVRKATQLQDAYAVDGVPALGIDGRYFTSGTQAQTLARALQVTDALIAQSRGKAK